MILGKAFHNSRMKVNESEKYKASYKEVKVVHLTFDISLFKLGLLISCYYVVDLE